HVDLVDLQSTPDRNYKWLFHYQDQATKFSFLRPLASKRAAEVAMELFKIFLKVCCPHILQRDNDCEFTAAVIEEFTAIEWIGKVIVKKLHLEDENLTFANACKIVRDLKSVMQSVDQFGDNNNAGSANVSAVSHVNSRKGHAAMSGGRERYHQQQHGSISPKRQSSRFRTRYQPGASNKKFSKIALNGRVFGPSLQSYNNEVLSNKLSLGVLGPAPAREEYRKVTKAGRTVEATNAACHVVSFVLLLSYC
ncbi:hypothetical protein ILUMI_03850, partial [Ignelater luminosus]